MLAVSVLGPFLLAVVIICVAPGPDMAFVMASGIARGRRAGMLAAGGVSLGVTAWVLATALGLGSLVTAFPQVSTTLRVVGGLYLLYLSWTTWRHAGDHGLADSGGTSRRMFWRGTLTNLANPKMALLFTAFLPQFVRPANGPVIVQFILLGLIMQAVGLLVDSLIGIAAGGAHDLFTRRPSMRTHLDQAAASVYAILAVAVGIEAFQ